MFFSLSESRLVGYSKLELSTRTAQLAFHVSKETT